MPLMFYENHVESQVGAVKYCLLDPGMREEASFTLHATSHLAHEHKSGSHCRECAAGNNHTECSDGGRQITPPTDTNTPFA